MIVRSGFPYLLYEWGDLSRPSLAVAPPLLVHGLREATRAREKSWYAKINIGDPTMSPNRARVSVSARPSITPRIRRQTCNARSCRPLPPVAPRSRCSRSRSSRGSSRPTPHVQTEDNEKTLGIHPRSRIPRLFFLQNSSVSSYHARGTIMWDD